MSDEQDSCDTRYNAPPATKECEGNGPIQSDGMFKTRKQRFACRAPLLFAVIRKLRLDHFHQLITVSREFESILASFR